MKLLNNYKTQDFKDLALEIIDTEEFDLVYKENGKLTLEDKKGANLGEIENEEFDDLEQVINRLEIYHKDYFFKDIEDWFGNDFFDHYKSTEQFLEYAEKHIDKFAEIEFSIRASELILGYTDKLKGEK